MPLDAQTQAVLDSIAASGAPPMHTLPVARARQAQLKAVAAMGVSQNQSLISKTAR